MTNFFADIDICERKVVPPALALDPAQAVAPWAQGAYLFTDNGVGQLAPAMARAGARPQWLQGGLGWNGSVLILPGSGSTIQTLAATLTTSGTVTHPAIATTNLLLSARHTLITTAATVNSAASLFTAQTLVWRGNASQVGGFYLCSRFALAISAGAGTALAQQGFCGLLASTSAIGNAVPSSLTNMVGIGADPTDTAFQIMNNDGSGTATKTSLGSGFPCNSGSGALPLQLELYCASNGASVYYRVMRLNDTSIAPATGVLSSDIPSTATMLAYHCHVNTGTANETTASLRHYRAYLETDV